MRKRKTTPFVIAALALAGIVLVGLRIKGRQTLQLVEGESVWRLSYNVRFHANRAGARIRVAMPGDTPNSRVFRQDVLYSGLSSDRVHISRSQNREANLITLRAGQFNLSARFDIHLSRRERWRANAPDSDLTADERAEKLRSTKTIQVESALVRDTLQRLRQDPDRPADPVQRLFDFCAHELERGDEDSPQDAAGALERQAAGPLGRARAFCALCRASKFPARLVTGFEVKEQKDRVVQPRVWVEVLTGNVWVPFDPENGFARELPHNFIPVRRDGVDIVHVFVPVRQEGMEVIHMADSENVEANFGLIRLPPTAGLSREQRYLLDVLDLTRLPLEMHEVLSLILLLPLGALVTSIFRTIIGIRTFGTFTPALIALSFVFADWRTGLLVFSLVMVLGLTSRSLLERLKLLMVPRLSIILTLVALCLVFAVSLLDYYGRTPAAQAVLLPMVILTMTVERFYLTSEEDGAGFALQLMAGTMAVALCCYLILRWDEVGAILFKYPELHLFTIAVLVLIGRYTGYRLTELWRFRDIVKE